MNIGGEYIWVKEGVLLESGVGSRNISGNISE